MADDRSKEILQKLKQTYAMPKRVETRNDPFKTLIVTIISQNTGEKNSDRAFGKLSKRFDVTPKALAKASTNQIEECLRVAGLYRNKAKATKQVSRLILEKFQGNLGSILSLPIDSARRKLLELPGVGPKTADVLLLFSAQKPTIPVDTHVNRLAKRLGLADEHGGYEDVRRSLQSLYDAKEYLAVHVLLIAHGRRCCKARRPLCRQCPVNSLCSSRSKGDKDD